MRNITTHVETFPLIAPFTIARGRKKRADVLMVEISEDGYVGRGEAVAYRRYGETMETARATIESFMPRLCEGATREELRVMLVPGAARNALDCALWDLEAKQAGRTVWELARLSPPKPLTTAFTITIDTPDKMARAAIQAQDFSLLKVKLGGTDGFLADIARLAAIRNAVPNKRLIVDINEGWKLEDLQRYASLLGGFDLELIEQPLPCGAEAGLAELALPLAADESVHDTASLDGLAAGYQWVNIKLDKAGGLTEALALYEAARARGYKIMVGCMVASSLSMAPAHILAQRANLVDLDGALWLARDREYGLLRQGDQLLSPDARLWGGRA